MPVTLFFLSPACGQPIEKKVAAIVTEYRHNSHADVIVSRLLLTDTLDGRGKDSPLKLASLYTDQRPPNDISRLLAAACRFPICDTVEGALTLGTGKLAVDGVLLIAEHGRYPKSATGNTQYPKRRLWEEVIRVFRASGRVVPVFVDKHLSDNWEDAKYIHETARRMRIPIMAGSSVPGTWRKPSADVPRGAKLKEIVALTYGSTDSYGFHALEALQALVEQRRGGETGIEAVQCLTGGDVWEAFDRESIDREIFQAAWDRLSRRQSGDRLRREAVAKPILFRIEYADGLLAHVVELNGAVGEWTSAWRYDDGAIDSTRFWTQEARPAYHFTLLMHAIERLILTGEPAWNIERTLITSGTLEALLTSRLKGGHRLETPYLMVSYQPIWRWKEPPPAPPGRPWTEQ